MTDEQRHSYGAEDLIERYPLHALSSLGIASLLTVAAFLYPVLVDFLNAKAADNEQLKVTTSRVINYSELSAPPPISIEQPEPEIVKAAPKIKTIKFLQPVAKKDEEVPDETEVPSMDDMEHTLIGTQNQDGIDSIAADIDFVIEIPPDPEPEPVEEEVFTIVEVMPEFEGGEQAMFRFLANEIEYPSVARESGIQGTVYIMFTIETDGSVSAVEIMRGVFKELDDEAIRAVEAMPKWIPGRQNGVPVRVKYVLPVRFKLT